MTRQRIHSAELWTHPWAYSYGISVKGGTLILLAGAIAVDKNGNLVGKGDMKAQIKQTMENIELALKAAGATLKDVIFRMVFTTDIDRYLELAEWRCQMFPDFYGSKPRAQEAAPATVVEVRRLFDKEALIEIQVFAHLEQE